MSEVLTGAGHYGEAQRLLDGALANVHMKPHQLQVILAEAQVHATLALAAATALPTTVRFVGDSAEVTDWAKAIQPTAIRTAPDPWANYPENWPPKHGDIWQDKYGRRWSGMRDGLLSCLFERADDPADEVHHRCGPLALVNRPEPTEEEAPF